MNRSMPPGTIIPELAYADVGEAVDWLCAAFGFRERLRIGDHRSQLTFADSSIIVTQTPPDAPPVSGHGIMVRVADADAHYRQALAHQANIISPPTDYPYGERQYVVEDIGGHPWSFSQTISDSDPAEWGGRLLSRT